MLDLEGGALAEALAHCELAQKKTGGFCAEAWAVSALAHARGDDKEGASRAAARARALTRANPLVWTYAGRALALVEDRTGARACFRQALDHLGPGHPLRELCEEGLAALERKR
jgi:Flp pilus assembly protein TadD